MRSPAVSSVLLVVLAAEARAEPPGMSAPTPPRKDPPPRKSPATALGLSLGFTAAGWLAFAADVSNGNDGPATGAPGLLLMYIGPSFGRWYGGGSAAVGLLTRTGASLLVVAAIQEDINHHVDDCVPDIDLGETCEGEDAAKARHDRKVKALLYTGAAIWIASSLYDIVMAPLDARDFNREHAITVAPTALSAGPGGALVPGLALGGRF